MFNIVIIALTWIQFHLVNIGSKLLPDSWEYSAIIIAVPAISIILTVVSALFEAMEQAKK